MSTPIRPTLKDPPSCRTWTTVQGVDSVRKLRDDSLQKSTSLERLHERTGVTHVAHAQLFRLHLLAKTQDDDGATYSYGDAGGRGS